MTQYAVYCRVELRHEYFARAPRGLFWVATPETQVELQNSHIRTKQLDATLLLVCEVDAERSPKRLPPRDSVLRFYLQGEDPNVLRLTNIDDSRLDSERFVLSNRADNSDALSLYLSQPVAARGAQHYPGDLVCDTGVIYECLSRSGPEPMTDTNVWFKKSERGYVSARDFQRFVGRLADFSLSVAATSASASVYARNPETLLYDLPLHADDVRVELLEARIARVSLRRLPRPGLYRVEINSESFLVYCDADALRRGALGVIELHQNLAADDPYSPMTATGALRDVRYVVQFANRRAFFAYHLSSDAITAIGTEEFVRDAVSRTFTSRLPLPVTDAATLDLKLLYEDGGERPAPLPDISAPGAFSLNPAVGGARQAPTFHMRVRL